MVWSFSKLLVHRAITKVEILCHFHKVKISIIYFDNIYYKYITIYPGKTLSMTDLQTNGYDTVDKMIPLIKKVIDDYNNDNESYY